MSIIQQIESITDEFCTTSNDTQGNDVPSYSTSVNLFHLETVHQWKEFRLFGPYFE